MKKILALVLALVMTMSMATISSGAAYSDADSVQYVDAVNTLSALGVLGGYADGSIRPQADVTRGAAAKMVAMVATGSNTTAIGYYAGTTSFADVPATHTFADAVAFCVARGIVAGYGNGLYGVADNVKGWAVAKMVLVAMGYDAEAYGLTGSGQDALNTITLASQVGLFAGMKSDFVATAAASREECAQIIYNALTIQGVAKRAVTTDGVTTYGDSGKCLLGNYISSAVYDDATKPALAQLSKGVITANDDTGAAYGYTEIGNVKLTNKTGKDLVGHMVAYVDTKAYNADGSITAFNVVDLSSVVTVSTADTYTLGTEAAYAAKFGSKDVANADDYMSFSNYNKDSQAREGVDGYAANAGTYVLYNGEIVSYLTAVSDLSVLDVATTNYAKGYYTVSLGEDVYAKVSANLDKSDFDKIVSDEAIDWLGLLSAYVTEEEVVYITTVCGSKLAIAPVQTVEGKITKVNDSAAKIYIDGKEYEYVTSESAAATALEISVMAAGLTDMTNTYTFYLDQAGKVFGYKAVTTADTNTYTPVYVVGTNAVPAGTDAYGTTAYNYNIQYYTMDGSVKLANYASLNGKKVVGTVVSSATEVEYDALVCGWYLMADVAGGVAIKEITDASGYYTDWGNLEDDFALTATTTSAFGGFINKASTFLYSDADPEVSATNKDALVKTGAHANTIAAESYVEVLYKDSANFGAYDVVAAWIVDDFAGEDLETEFVYVVSYEGYIGVDATKTYALQSYKVIDKNGNAVDATYAVATEDAADYVGGWYALTTNTATGLTTFDGEYSETITWVEGAESYVIDGVTYLNNGSEFVVASDVKFHDLRAAVVEYYTEEAATSVAAMQAIEGEDWAADAIFTVDTVTGVKTIIAVVIFDYVEEEAPEAPVVPDAPAQGE